MWIGPRMRATPALTSEIASPADLDVVVQQVWAGLPSLPLQPTGLSDRSDRPGRDEILRAFGLRACFSMRGAVSGRENRAGRGSREVEEQRSCPDR